MSKKLLEEAAVRKFMKIAGLQPLTSTFLKESEEVQEEAKKKYEEGKEGLDEVEDLEEGKVDLEEVSKKEDDKKEDDKKEDDKKDKMEEVKSLSPAKPSKMKGESHKMKPAKKAGGLVKEEEMPEDDMGDVEASVGGEEEMGAPEADPATEAAVKKLLGVITAALAQETGVQISMEDEGSGQEAEVEVGGEEETEEEMEGGDGELDEAALENVVAETVKRVKARLSESSSKPNKKTLTKEALAKKVAARVAERLKKH